MNRFTLTCAILFTCVAFAFAGPEPLPSGKEMKAVAEPTVEVCPDWGGFYVGGFGGFKFADTDVDVDLEGDWPFVPGFEDLEHANSGDLDFEGGELGGLIGYNFQAGKWVFGLEAAGGYLWLRDSDHFDDVVAINTYGGFTSIKSQYMVTIGPRIGYAFCRWLPYVTGGVALADVDFKQGFHILGAPVFGQEGSEDEMQVGWMVGGGMEYALTNHWRMRFQYQYIDLGSVDFDTVFTDASDFTAEHEAEMKEHNVSCAIIFGF